VIERNSYPQESNLKRVLLISGTELERNCFALGYTYHNTEFTSLADEISGTQQLLSWDKITYSFQFYMPDPIFPGGFGTNFLLELAGAYFVLVDSSAPAFFTVAGIVPPQTRNLSSVQFNLVGGCPCQWNLISIPRDQTGVGNAQELADRQMS
jgi:hypothetical protein